ncbi:unnamed protein product [Fusarium equiseti]|uniref:N-acetyltransferase domain-containing protein n=1 Tax=Fusarium equiseti TaxID=61235 RepID=A0A8J2II87_FUSEQ|nr:unnamed protein product [Fusarium equiseti]
MSILSSTAWPEGLQLHLVNTSEALQRWTPSLANLLQSCVNDDPPSSALGFHAPLTTTNASDFWLALSPQLPTTTALFVLARDSTVVGTVQLVTYVKATFAHKVEIVKLLVSEKERGVGLGRQLMGFAESACAQLTAMILSLLTLASLTSAAWIVPGARWKDTDGNLFNAHAGGLCVDRDSGKFFWFGEYKTEEQEEGGGISVYSSSDLATWESHGLALTPEEGHEHISPESIIQRPKVLYSEDTGKYHMWWHADDRNYSLLLQGLATSDNIAGPYEFNHAIAPLGNWSQDFGAFTDYKSGKSYALYSNGDRVEGRDVYVSEFNSNLTDIKSVTHRFNKYDFEAPTILQTEKSYWTLMSHKTGYRPNNVVAMRADKLEGPWSQPFFVAPAYTRTFSTQSGFSWRINGTKKTTYLYMADQWDLPSIWESRNVWLPIEIDEKEKSLKVVWHDIYDLNVKTGEWKPIKGKTYPASKAKLAGDAFLQEATFGTDHVIATGIQGNDSTITFEVEGKGADQWVSFYHQNTDDMGFGDQPMGQPDRINGTWAVRRISSVVVNNETDKVHTLFQKDTHKGIILSTPLLLPLKKGKNSITVGGLDNGKGHFKGADLDRIVVYPPEKKKEKRFFGLL